MKEWIIDAAVWLLPVWCFLVVFPFIWGDPSEVGNEAYWCLPYAVAMSGLALALRSARRVWLVPYCLIVVGLMVRYQTLGWSHG